MKIDFYFETMAGTHLADAVRGLRNAGSSDTLYGAEWRVSDAAHMDEADWQMARDVAHAKQVSYSRRALLFAAFAAEAYANDFIFARWRGQDREALRWLSPIDKYVIVSQLAGIKPPLDRGREPLQRLKWLFDRRNELVHAVPRDNKDFTYDPDNHNPDEAAKSIVAVADAAARLEGQVHYKSVLAYVLAERAQLLAFGASFADAIPHLRDSPAAADLLEAARHRAWATSH